MTSTPTSYIPLLKRKFIDHVRLLIRLIVIFPFKKRAPKRVYPWSISTPIKVDHLNEYGISFDKENAALNFNLSFVLGVRSTSGSADRPKFENK